MVNSRAKGNRAMRAIVDYLVEKGFDWIGKREAGESGDDIVGFKDFSIEIKDQAKMDLSGWMDQSISQRKGKQIPVVWHKRKGKPNPADWYVTMPGWAFTEIVAHYTGVKQ